MPVTVPKARIALVTLVALAVSWFVGARLPHWLVVLMEVALVVVLVRVALRNRHVVATAAGLRSKVTGAAQRSGESQGLGGFAPQSVPRDSRPVPPLDAQSPQVAPFSPRPERFGAYVAGAGAVSSAHPALSADARSGGGFQLLAVTIMGEGHAIDRTPREDAYAAVFDGDGCWVIAVADGLSGASDSRLAANALVNQAVTVIGARTDWEHVPSLINDGVDHAIEASRRDSAQRNRALGHKVEVGSLGPKATLTVARVIADPAGVVRVDLAGVGNSPVLRVARSTAPEELLPLHERPDGRTPALPATTPDWKLGGATLAPHDCLVLCTDGFERLYVENEDELLALVTGGRPPWSTLPELVSVFVRPTQGDSDDRTALFLSQTGALHA